jgi:hypothetical protein
MWTQSPIAHGAARNARLPRDRAVVYTGRDQLLHGFELFYTAHDVRSLSSLMTPS